MSQNVTYGHRVFGRVILQNLILARAFYETASASRVGGDSRVNKQGGPVWFGE
jgi:hypothetical protein